MSQPIVPLTVPKSRRFEKKSRNIHSSCTVVRLILTRLFELVEAIYIEKTHRIIMNMILCVLFWVFHFK